LPWKVQKKLWRIFETVTTHKTGSFELRMGDAVPAETLGAQQMVVNRSLSDTVAPDPVEEISTPGCKQERKTEGFAFSASFPLGGNYPSKIRHRYTPGGYFRKSSATR
jgi:hypothetical protein